MAHQPVTAELRRWIVDQAAAGHPPDIVIDAMKASGWDEAVAMAALETTLRGHLDGDDGDAAAKPVPGGAIGAGKPSLRAADRDVRVVMALTAPRIVVFADLLSADECAELIALARTRLTRSETVETTSGGNEVNEARTSDGMFFAPGEFPVCARLERRLAALVDWPLENGEGLQVLRYRPGAEYRPHYDYFDPAESGTPTILKRGGQRVASIVCYLNTPEGGGATIFPDVGLEVAPVRGNAVFFSYDRPHPSTRTLHGGAAVTAGEKWVATKWLREGRFE
ncbi:MAG TPA: 2OG-Fe(II) oxygenase [Burkholderiales bacterium]|jgi:prolyl 4-hydroxylase